MNTPEYPPGLPPYSASLMREHTPHGPSYGYFAPDNSYIWTTKDGTPYARTPPPDYSAHTRATKLKQ